MKLDEFMVIFIIISLILITAVVITGLKNPNQLFIIIFLISLIIHFNTYVY